MILILFQNLIPSDEYSCPKNILHRRLINYKRVKFSFNK